VPDDACPDEKTGGIATPFLQPGVGTSDWSLKGQASRMVIQANIHLPWPENGVAT